MGTSSIALRKALKELAEQQGGYFTAQQAIAIGYNDAVHGYHVKEGHWERAGWGIYRVASIPKTPWSDLHRILLWSRNKSGIIQGAFCGTTARAIATCNQRGAQIRPYQLCVPRSFRRSAPIPGDIELFFEDLCADDVKEVAGLRITFFNLGEHSAKFVTNPNIFSGTEDFAEIIRRGED